LPCRSSATARYVRGGAAAASRHGPPPPMRPTTKTTARKRMGTPFAWGNHPSRSPGVARRGAIGSARVQEGDDLILLRLGQRREGVPCGGSLPVVQGDRLRDGLRPAVVQEPRLAADAPQRCRAYHARTGRAGGDAVTQRSHVVQQEVRERVEGLVVEE